jgi:hypothetical protein
MAKALDALPDRGTRERAALAERAAKAVNGQSAEQYLNALVSIYEVVRKERR